MELDTALHGRCSAHPHLSKEKFEVRGTGKIQKGGPHIYMGTQSSFLIRASLSHTIEFQLWRGKGGKDRGCRRLKFKNECNQRSFIFCKQFNFNVKKTMNNKLGFLSIRNYWHGPGPCLILPSSASTSMSTSLKAEIALLSLLPVWQEKYTKEHI